MSTYKEPDTVVLPQETQEILVGVTVLVIVIVLGAEVTTPEVVFLIALVFMMLTGILSLKDVLSGFANEGLITIGSLFFVVRAVEKSYIVDYLARRAFGITSGPILGMGRMLSTCCLLSSVFNNTPLVAFMMPVVRDWGRLKNIPVTQLLMPMEFAVIAGGMLTMIGTSPSLTVQGLMQADRGFEFGFFAPGAIALPCAVVFIVYILFAAPYLLPHHNGLIREIRDKASDLIVEIEVMPNASVIGQQMGQVVGGIGLSATSVLKIRRGGRRSSSIDLSDEYPQEGIELGSADRASIPLTGEEDGLTRDAQSVNEVADPEYVQQNISKWGLNKGSHSLVPTAGLGDYAASNTDILNPTPQEPLQAGDVLFIKNAVDVVGKLFKSIGEAKGGLKLLSSSVMDLPGYGSELIEVVLSHDNPFIGRKLYSCVKEFNEKYRVAMISSRMHETLVEKADDVEAHVSVDANKRSLSAGDAILCLIKSAELKELHESKDFYVVSAVGSVPPPVSYYAMIPLVVFFVLISLVASEEISMCSGALTVSAFFFIGGWITPKEIPSMLEVRLLMLLGCSISFAKAMSTSGLSESIATAIVSADASPANCLFILYTITMVITLFISNNACAALMYPIGVAMADELGVSFKPFAMVVLIASSAEFAIPIGYQTHVMVWGPGGYKFLDFVKFGFLPSFIYMIGCCLIAPSIYPF